MQQFRSSGALKNRPKHNSTCEWMDRGAEGKRQDQESGWWGKRGSGWGSR